MLAGRKNSESCPKHKRVIGIVNKVAHSVIKGFSRKSLYSFLCLLKKGNTIGILEDRITPSVAITLSQKPRSKTVVGETSKMLNPAKAREVRESFSRFEDSAIIISMLIHPARSMEGDKPVIIAYAVINRNRITREIAGRTRIKERRRERAKIRTETCKPERASM